MISVDFEAKTKTLIDGLKAICASYGLGNDGNEYKIITQAFLYKFLNDKFACEAKKIRPKLAGTEDWTMAIKDLNEDDYEMLLMELGVNSAKIKPQHFISELFCRQNDSDFAKRFDDTLREIAILNAGIFSVMTEGGAKIQLFESISNYITDPAKRDNFCRAIINKLVEFSFENIFEQKYDFFATIFEYLIKDYNKDSGGKYAEYYTPHAVAKIMAAIMVPQETKNVTCYDPAAGSGTLLMSIAHTIGEERCTIYSQDISQKSSTLLRLNLILNNLVHSLPNIIQGNTILHPYHKQGRNLMSFDYIVSNPPFKTDFSDYRNDLDTDAQKKRFFAGIPNIPKKAKNKMAIYQLFIQHIIISMSNKGKAAIVVPTGFITAQTGIDKKIRQKMVDDGILAGVVSMPSNIFATTGTNVSIIFLDKQAKGKVVLIDASKLGKKIKDNGTQRTVLSSDDEQKIIGVFNSQTTVDDFSVVVDFDQIKARKYSLSAGQYFDIKIEYVDITEAEFRERMKNFSDNLDVMFKDSRRQEELIKKQLGRLCFE